MGLFTFWNAASLKKFAAFRAAHEKDPKKKPAPKPPRRDRRMEALLDVLSGKRPALIRAERDEEIGVALALSTEHTSLRGILLGGSNALRRLDALRAAGWPVFVRGLPMATLDRGRRMPLATTLARGRVPVAIGSGATSTSLLDDVGTAIRDGFSARAGLASLTSTPARALGVAGRIGHVKKGCDADLVLLTRDPGEPGCRVHMVIAGGKVVHEEDGDE